MHWQRLKISCQLDDKLGQFASARHREFAVFRSLCVWSTHRSEIIKDAVISHKICLLIARRCIAWQVKEKQIGGTWRLVNTVLLWIASHYWWRTLTELYSSFRVFVKPELEWRNTEVNNATGPRRILGIRSRKNSLQLKCDTWHAPETATAPGLPERSVMRMYTRKIMRVIIWTSYEN